MLKMELLRDVPSIMDMFLKKKTFEDSFTRECKCTIQALLQQNLIVLNGYNVAFFFFRVKPSTITERLTVSILFPSEKGLG